MPDKRKPTPTPSARQAGDESTALIMGTRCEECAAPVWPVGSSCRYCARSRAADARLREHRAAAASRVEHRAASRALAMTPTGARLQRDAERACNWPADVPRPLPCACVPCVSRRVLATLESEVLR